MRLEENNSGARERLPPARCDATERLRYKAQSPFSSPELERYSRARQLLHVWHSGECSPQMLPVGKRGTGLPYRTRFLHSASSHGTLAWHSGNICRANWCHHPSQKRAPITNISSCFIKCSDGAPLSPQADYVDLTTITFTGGSIQISVTLWAVQLSHLLTLCDSDSDTWRGHHS